MPKQPAVLDLETESIDAHPRPGSPPPGGLAFLLPGGVGTYAAWGHPTNNGIYELRRVKGKDTLVRKEGDPKQLAAKVIKDAFKGEVLGHNIAKFDLPVIEDHLHIAPPKWDKVHDTMFQLFLDDPHSSSLSLKPAAERYLGEAPRERDAVFDWLAAHGIIPKPKIEKGKAKYKSDAGAYIMRAPGDLVALYAIGDCTRTLGLHEKIFPKLKADTREFGGPTMLDAYDTERELAAILLENERQGIRVDMDALDRDLPLLRVAQLRAEDWLRKRLKIKESAFVSGDGTAGFNFDSDAHIAQALRSAGVVKKFPQTATGKDSVSKKNLKIKFYEDPKVYFAIHYRNTMATVLTQSLEKWFREGQRDGKIYREWNQVRQAHGEDNKTKGARSGRVTVSGLANIAKRFGAKDPSYKHPAFMRVPEPPLARDYVLPDEGDLFGHCDFDQQEMKITAHYEDGALAAAYRADPKTDIHVKVHEWIVETSGKDYDRDTVKMADFLISYGGGASGLAERLEIPLDDAKEIIHHWRRALPDVVKLDNDMKARFKAGDYLRTLGGRIYYCKPPTIAKKGNRKGQMIHFEYTALNYLIQPSAADQTKRALIKYHKHPERRGRLLVTVYDEINVSMPDVRELDVLNECMCCAYQLDVPVTTTAKAGPSWGKLEKIASTTNKKEKAA